MRIFLRPCFLSSPLPLSFRRPPSSLCPTSPSLPLRFPHRMSSSSLSSDPLVQYVVVRRDFDPPWPAGALIAQGVHASVSAIWESRDTPITKEYCLQTGSQENSLQMHTVVLEAKSEKDLVKLKEKLESLDIGFVEWIERPEGVRTAIASWPGKRSQLKAAFGKFRLFK